MRTSDDPREPADDRSRHVDADRAVAPVDPRIERAVERLAPRHLPRLAEHLAILVPAVLGVGLLALLTWAAGEIYESVLAQDDLASLDRPALFSAMSIRDGWLDSAVTAFTTIGGPLIAPIVAAVTVIVLALIWRSWLPITLMVAATAGSLAVTIVGKNYLDRVRPPHEYAVAPYEWSPSFPSGHSLNSVVIGGVIAYLLCRHLRSRGWRIAIISIAAVYALLMGLSRVYLGHHWLTDVLTGWILGLGWLGAVIAAHQVALALKRRRQARAADSAAASAGSRDAQAAVRA